MCKALVLLLSVLIGCQAWPADQAAAETCTIGQPGSGEVLAVTADYDLRTAPSGNGKRIKNEKASAVLKTTHYHQIDSSTTVRQLCVHDDWSEVQIVTPDWLTFVQGWVPNRVLRGIEKTDDGIRVYVESDFLWDEQTSRYKSQILAIVNKVAREHKGCDTLDTASVALSSSRSKPNDPVFFVTCAPTGTPFNVWFRPTDTDKTFSPIAAIPEPDAIQSCEQAAKDAAAHPSTVEFSRVLDVAYSARPDGRVSLDSTFTARNAFNLELKYNIRCLFDGRKLIEAKITEAR